MRSSGMLTWVLCGRCGKFDHVRAALKIVKYGDGRGLYKRRITLSASVVVPMMARAG